MLVFDDATIHGLDLQEAGFLDAATRALVAHRNGELLAEPKRTLTSTAGAYATGTHGLWPQRRLAFFHNLVGLERSVPGTQGSGYRSVQTLFRLDQARPVLMAHGSAISSLVPVVVSCIAAQALCDLTRVRRVGLIGAGLQARLHLQALSRMASVPDGTRLLSVCSIDRLTASRRRRAGAGGGRTRRAARRRRRRGPRGVINLRLAGHPTVPRSRVAKARSAAGVGGHAAALFRSVPEVKASVIVDEMRQALQMASANRIPRDPGFDLELAEFFGTHPPQLAPVGHPGADAPGLLR
jgi:hypothetical protein